MQQQPMNGTPSGAVYVQTNAAPNEVISFRRAADGSLEPVGSWDGVPATVAGIAAS
jgi:hypothetical protein